jgi:hypothetical protein
MLLKGRCSGCEEKMSEKAYKQNNYFDNNLIRKIAEFSINPELEFWSNV